MCYWEMAIDLGFEVDPSKNADRLNGHLLLFCFFFRNHSIILTRMWHKINTIKPDKCVSHAQGCRHKQFQLFAIWRCAKICWFALSHLPGSILHWWQQESGEVVIALPSDVTLPHLLDSTPLVAPGIWRGGDRGQQCTNHMELWAVAVHSESWSGISLGHYIQKGTVLDWNKGKVCQSGLKCATKCYPPFFVLY